MSEHVSWETISKHLNDQSFEQEGNDIPTHMIHTVRHNTGVFFGTKVIKYEDLVRKGVTTKVPSISPVKVSPADKANVPQVAITRIARDYTHGDAVPCFIGKPQDEDGHVMVVGGPGSGKSTCVAIPTLGTWKGSIFAIDIKGELINYWNQIQGPKRPAKVFNLTKDQGSFASYDPFYFLRLESEEDNLVQNAREIAQAIIPLPPDTKEPFWIQSAQQVLTATILHGVGIGASFNDTMTRILTTPIWELVEEIGDAKSDNLAAQLHIAQFKGIKNPADNKMLIGISAELNNRVMVFVTNILIKEAFTPNDDSIRWDDLETHNIFIRVSEDRLGQYDGAISLMLTQLIRSLERRPDKQYTSDGIPLVLLADGEVIPPTLLLLDEFPRLGKVDVIQNALSTLRSKGVTICLVMQSLAQLDRIYGKESRQIIVDTCQYKAILQVTDPENQKIISDMIGSIIVPRRSYNAAFNDTAGENTQGSSYQISESLEPIILPHKLATLNDVALVTPKGFCRVNKAPYYGEAEGTAPESLKRNFAMLEPPGNYLNKDQEVTYLGRDK